MNETKTPAPARTVVPVTITKNTLIEGEMTDEDLCVMACGYNSYHKCGMDKARAAIERHHRGGLTYQFTLYELIAFLGPFLSANPDDLVDSVLNTGLVVVPDAFDLMALTGDLPAIDA